MNKEELIEYFRLNLMKTMGIEIPKKYLNHLDADTSYIAKDEKETETLVKKHNQWAIDYLTKSKQNENE